MVIPSVDLEATTWQNNSKFDLMKNGENWKILESLYSFRNVTGTVIPVHQQNRCYLVPGHPISLQKP